MHLSLHRRRFSVLCFLFRSWHFFGHMLSQATSEDDTEEGAEAADKVADDPSGPSEGEDG